MSDTREIISDWMLSHMFFDDCGYPLISPSDVVLDDLEYRLSLFELGNDRLFINKKSKERWETIPYSKGKERRLRRK